MRQQKIKESQSEIKIEDERKHTEKLEIHRERGGIKLIPQINDKIEKLILQTTENNSDICEAFKRNKQLADQIAAWERIHLKYATLVKYQHGIEVIKNGFYHFKLMQ